MQAMWTTVVVAMVGDVVVDVVVGLVLELVNEVVVTDRQQGVLCVKIWRKIAQRIQFLGVHRYQWCPKLFSSCLRQPLERKLCNVCVLVIDEMCHSLEWTDVGERERVQKFWDGLDFESQLFENSMNSETSSETHKVYHIRLKWSGISFCMTIKMYNY